MRLSMRLALILALLLLLMAPVFSQEQELYVQSGHSSPVTTVAFSPDGKTLASGSGDRTIRLWDSASGQELRTLTFGSSVSFRSEVAFSPDGKTLATASAADPIQLWDVASGQELKILGERGVTSVAFSPDGNTLASGRGNGIQLWDVVSGQELKTLGEHSAGITSFAFSPDGKTLASGSGNGIHLWDVASGRELRTLGGHSAGVKSVAFSPDGKTLASGSGNGIQLWDVASGKELKVFVPASADNTIKLPGVTSGQELKTLKGNSSSATSVNDVNAAILKQRSLMFSAEVAFSPDGKTLATVSGANPIQLWDVASGQELKTLKGYLFAAFSPDGQTLASGSGYGIKLWDVGSGQELKTLKGNSSHVRSVAFSPDGKMLAFGLVTIKLWDTVSGQLKTLKGSFEAVAFSPDGKTLATGSILNPVKLWDVASGQELKTFGEHSAGVTSVAFSPDGKTLATGSVKTTKLRGTIKLWDVDSGRELKTLEGQPPLAFSPDGKTLVSRSDPLIKLWDVASGQELKALGRYGESVTSFAFSPDSKTLASGSSMKGTIKLWDVAFGQELKVLVPAIDDHTIKLPRVASGQGRIIPIFPPVQSVAFSPDGKTLASGSSDAAIKLWDVGSGQELKTLRGHSSSIYSVAFSPDGKMLESGSWDNTIKLWDASSGNNLASLIAPDDRDWAVVTPDGLFDGSPNAWKQLIWRLDNNTFKFAPVEAFFKEFYYPGLLQEIMEGKRPRPSAKNLANVDIRQPEVSITRVGGQLVQELGFGRPATLPNAVSQRNVEVEIQITDNTNLTSRPNHPPTSGAQDLRLFRNGSLVKVWRGVLFDKQSGCDQIVVKQQAPRGAICKVTVPLVAGDNLLTAYAFNHENVKSNDGEASVKGAESLRRAGTLYTLAIGVNEYANSQYNLKYAVADVQDFAAELKLQQAKLRNYARVEVISLIDRDATKASILKSLADLSTKIQPEDALIIYFAGHGTAQQNRFYLIPHDIGYSGSRTQLDSAGLKNILAHSISDEELERAVEGIDAGQLSLVIDACNSGQALESEEKRRGPMNSRGLAQLAYEKGMYILTAAQSYQAAQEAERLGHGFLTYALVEEGLKTSAADRDKDEQVVLREWLDYATQRVPQMQQEKLEEQRKQGRQLDRIKFAATDSGNERSVQRPRVFYRREAETHPLVVAKLGTGEPIKKNDSAGANSLESYPAPANTGLQPRQPIKPATSDARAKTPTSGTSTGEVVNEAKTDPTALELSYWETIKNSTDLEDFKAYLAKYPNGQFADLAQVRVRFAKRVRNPASGDVVAAEHARNTNVSEERDGSKTSGPPAQAPILGTGEIVNETKTDPTAFELSFWETIKNSTDPEDFKAYLAKYPNGQFAELAKSRAERPRLSRNPASGDVSAPERARNTQVFEVRDASKTTGWLTVAPGSLTFEPKKPQAGKNMTIQCSDIKHFERGQSAVKSPHVNLFLTTVDRKEGPLVFYTSSGGTGLVGVFVKGLPAKPVVNVTNNVIRAIAEACRLNPINQ